MKPLRLLFAKIGICLSLYSVATIWHFSRRSYSSNSALLYSDCSPTIEPTLIDLQQTAILLPTSNKENRSPIENRKSSTKEYRILFVKEDEKR